MTNYFQMLISLFSILNPILAITVYLDITHGMSKEERKKVAITCTTAVFLLLTGFLFIGQILLSMLSVHDYSIRIAGGLIVLLIGILMVIGPNDEEEKTKDKKEQVYGKDSLISLGISPLALPLLVGPAAIVMVMLYGQEVHGVLGKLAVESIIIISSILVFVILMASSYISKALGKVGLIVLTKIMGLIISAVAVEMIVEGLKTIVPILTRAA